MKLARIPVVHLTTQGLWIYQYKEPLSVGFAPELWNAVALCVLNLERLTKTKGIQQKRTKVPPHAMFRMVSSTIRKDTQNQKR